MILRDVHCTVCGAADLVAIAPGREGDDFADLFAVDRGEPVRAWCAECWPSRPHRDRNAG